jgi:hypothetical protein
MDESVLSLARAYWQDKQDFEWRPSTRYKPKLSIDGDKWCALYGKDLQGGVAGFGDSPEKAYENFDKNWIKSLKDS